MNVIKKYANRKLYHINRKRYITLEGVADLVRAGEQVQVIENDSGEDITAAVLAQVALAPRTIEPLPVGVIAEMIRSGSDRLSDLQRSLITMLGGEHVVDMLIGERIARLREAGTLDALAADRIETLLLSSANSASASSVLSRSDMTALHARVDELADLVEQVIAERADA